MIKFLKWFFLKRPTVIFKDCKFVDCDIKEIEDSFDFTEKGTKTTFKGCTFEGKINMKNNGLLL